MKFDISLASRSRKSASEHKNIIVMTHFKALTVTFLLVKWHLMFLSLNVRGEPSAEQILAEANWKHEWIVRRALMFMWIEWEERANCTIFILISTTSIIQWGPRIQNRNKKIWKNFYYHYFQYVRYPVALSFAARSERSGEEKDFSHTENAGKVVERF